MTMPTVDEQLLRLKEYPARLVIGRATESGVLILDDYVTLVDYVAASRRIADYERINIPGLEYRYEVVKLADVESVMSTMRQELQVEAQQKGLPTGDWK